MKYRFTLAFAALLAAGCVSAQSAQTQVPLSPRQWANKADVAVAEKNPVAAIEANKKALAGSYVRPSLYYSLACLYAQHGDIELAFGVLKQSVNTDRYQHEEMRNE